MIEALTTASAIGGLIAFIVAVIIIPYCLAGDEPSNRADVTAIAWAIFAMAAVIFGFNPQLSLAAWAISVPAYFAIGLLWFLWQWRQLILRKLAETKTSWDRAPSVPFEDFARSRRPEASRYKETIAGWIVLWPWGVAWTVLQWPWRLATHLAEWARGIADRMVDRLWRA